MSTKLERVVGIIAEINRGSYPTVASLCDKFEIAQRTLHDDLRFIKDRLQIEILFDKSRQGYYNSTPGKTLPLFDLSPDEFLAIQLGTAMLLEHSGPVFRVQLQGAFHKIANRLADGNGMQKEIKSLVRFIPGGLAVADGKLVRSMENACSSFLSVEIDYYGARKGQTETRTIDPYRLIEFDGAWYVVGWCHLRDDMRTFALHRIRRYKVLKEKFTLKEGFDLDKWLESAFLLEHADGEQTVRIKFDPLSARYALERTWHRSQQVTTHGDGACTIQFNTQSLDEVKRWVLKFGSGAEVIDPPELRKRVMDELSSALRGYGGATS